ncbi:MAG: GNAT family N-acetyltransferase [Betaproteobacteria bacterium]|nr:GNAT family N-acetyltransferase [Betaproteobacteria bacterium]
MQFAIQEVPHAQATLIDLTRVRELFLEYAAWLNEDLCFQGFKEELAGLPGAYARPDGRLLLAMLDAQAAGCIALRRFDADTAEVKRLWVRPAFRAGGLGRALAGRIIGEAREAGYRRLVLDTLAPMAPAIALYRSLGFREIAAYYDNPLPGAVYMGLELNS